MSNSYNDEARDTLYHSHAPHIQIKGDYVYASNLAGDIRVVSMVTLVRLILTHGDKIE